MGGPFQSLYHVLIGSIIDPRDDFTQRLRKSVFGFLFFPCSILSFIFAIFVTVAFQTYQSTAGFVLMTIFFIGAYFWMRHHRHVSDWLCTIYVWVFAVILCFSNYFVAPETDNKSLLFMTVFVALTLRVRFLPVFMVFSVLIQATIDWNLAQISADKMYIAFPNAHINMEFPVRLNSQFVGTFLLFLGAYLFYLQIKETEKQVNAQLAANEMTVRVLKVQRNYDCERIDVILEQCSEQGVVDDEMIKLFRVMNSNLKSYKPFLPNYLFQDDSNNDDDDDDDPKRNGQDAEDLSEGVSASRRKKNRMTGDDDDSEGALSQASTSAVSARKSPNPSSAGGRKYRRGGADDNISECSSRQSTRRIGRGGNHPPHRGGKDSATASTHGGSSFTDPAISASSSLAANLSKKRGQLFTGRITVALVDLNLGRIFQPDGRSAEERQVVSSTDRQLSSQIYSPEATALSASVYESLVNALFSTAASAKASIHSLIGDCAQLTWNATHSVALGEVKAAVFFARLSKALKHLSSTAATTTSINNNNNRDDFVTPAAARITGSIVATGAIFTGKATAHSLLTSGTQQRALILEARWFPLLSALAKLAERHKCVLLDSTTYKSALLEVDAVPVERIIVRRRSPQSSSLSSCSHRGDRFFDETTTHDDLRRFLYHPPLSTAGRGTSSPFSESSPTSTNNDVKNQEEPEGSRSDEDSSSSLAVSVFMLVAEKERKDDEWMYQLQQDSQHDLDAGLKGQAEQDATIVVDKRLHCILDSLEKSQFGTAVDHVHQLMMSYDQQQGTASPTVGDDSERQRQGETSTDLKDGKKSLTAVHSPPSNNNRTKVVLSLLHKHKFLQQMSDHCDAMLLQKKNKESL